MTKGANGCVQTMVNVATPNGSIPNALQHGANAHIEVFWLFSNILGYIQILRGDHT